GVSPLAHKRNSVLGRESSELRNEKVQHCDWWLVARLRTTYTVIPTLEEVRWIGRQQFSHRQSARDNAYGDCKGVDLRGPAYGEHHEQPCPIGHHPIERRTNDQTWNEP